jgi:chemotaxis-related protein WspB
MLFLLFQLDSDYFALDVSGIAKVLPLVAITPMPQMPSCVAGLINYHGTSVPAIDLSVLALQRPAQRRLSTRIVLINYLDGRGGKGLLALIAEKATGTMRADPGMFSSSGLSNASAPYLGPVLATALGLVQWVNPQLLLPPALRDLLSRDATAG